jgi:hypothetical protein
MPAPVARLPREISLLPPGSRGYIACSIGDRPDARALPERLR